MQKIGDVRRRWEAVADAIERYPHLYEQQTWGEPVVPYQHWCDGYEECGTRACVAGWACALNGYFPTVRSVTITGRPPRVRFTWEMVNREPLQTAHDPGSLSASGVAAELLGLDAEEEELAFHFATWWTPDRLRRVAKGEITPQEVHWGEEDDE